MEPRPHLVSQRPVFLDLLRIRLPLPGWVSIGHRVSGAALLLALPLAVGLLGLSLSGPEGFAEARAILSSLPARLLGMLLLWGLFHHLFAGIRFLLLDLHWGLPLAQARLTAWAALAAGLAGGLWAAGRLW